ncbi:RAD50-interacting protein 1 [Neocloeon triangulifer]|uniref:RAD50-interacting protein 1 n=1 Tax=Neocloeon triangulifer TaxID=2078957 RepID=UPI00286EF4D7|nr:RAD50-interacting protein 1 [Neocloeon triangulifer]
MEVEGVESLLSEAVRELNEEIGSHVDKAREAYQQYTSEKHEIEQMLDVASSAARVTAAVHEVESVSSQIATVVEQYDTLSVHRKGQLEEQLQTQVERVGQLEAAVAYLKRIQELEAISNQLEANFHHERQAVERLGKLAQMAAALSGSNCHHLTSFYAETQGYWHTLIREKLSTEFDDILKEIKWPMVADITATPSPDSLARFDSLVELLLLLEMTEGHEVPKSRSALLSDFLPPPLPLQLMVRPLRRRFLYHFSGSRQTNRLDKPEWFMAQVLAWIREHVTFLSQRVQPVLDKVKGDEAPSAQIEFSRALVQLVLEKLHSELSILEQDDALFAHALDETLSFDKELRSGLGYPISQPGVVGVLTQAPVFVKWIAMEKKYAGERMDRMLCSETAWQALASQEEQLKVTECADAFIALLATMTDRFRHLPQPGHRLQFVELQLELIEEWRVRLVQILREERLLPLASRLPAILNSVCYVAAVLREWAEQPLLLQLQLYRQGHVQGCVFDDALQLLESLSEELLETLTESVLLDVKAKSREYRKDKWFCMTSDENTLTPSACEMMQILSARLLQLKELLAESSFNKAWHSLATHLSQFLMEELVLENWFSSGGGCQFQYDLIHGLFPLFGQFMARPDNLFKPLKEACILLTLASGSAKLLAEVLRDEVDPTDALAELGLHRLNPQEAREILSRRNDISASDL